MKAGILALVTRRPLIAPHKAPASRLAGIAVIQGRSSPLTASAPTTPEKPTTEPSERSMPAAQITKVAPTASTPITAVASRMLRKLEMLRK